MDVFTLNVIGLSLQLIGITIAASGILVEMVYKSTLLTFLAVYLREYVNAIPIMKSTPLYRPFLEADEKALYRLGPAWFFMVLMFNLPVLIINLGFFVALVLQMTSEFRIGIPILAVWGFILAVTYTIGSLIHCRIVRTQRPQDVNTTSKVATLVVKRFIMNWFRYPIIALRVNLCVLLVIVIHGFAWLICLLPMKFHIDLSNKETRERYYVIYSFLALLSGTSLILSAVVIGH